MELTHVYMFHVMPENKLLLLHTMYDHWNDRSVTVSFPRRLGLS
jgi:hypothetical protein